MRKLRYILHCKCGASTDDIRTNPNAWNGWTFAPAQVCPTCQAADIAQRPTHQIMQFESHSAGKTIKTFVIVPIGQGRSI